jgi:hypothetical protein
MPINDTLTQIDLIPGLSDGHRQDAAPHLREGNNSNSEYRRALSRTLSRDDRREQTATTRTETADARQPPTPSDIRARRLSRTIPSIVDSTRIDSSFQPLATPNRDLPRRTRRTRRSIVGLTCFS